MTKFVLDSGIVAEYEEISSLALQNGSELWGATTNPTLIAQNFSNNKITQEEANKLHKEIVLKLVEIVPGGVSAEVYADQDTTAEEMIQQGKEIATWHERIVVKIPTTIEGFKARTELRKSGILTNNTLVFSQEQIFAICLHESLVQKEYGPIANFWPPFISPFVGRLDDKGLNGMDLVRHGMRIKKLFASPTWMLEASVRNLSHFQHGIDNGSELITAPAKIYKAYYAEDSTPENTPLATLQDIPAWIPEAELVECPTIDLFMQSLSNGRLNIAHELTDSGIEKFSNDWNAVIST